MTLTTHGIREGSKANTSDEAKVKEREKEKAEEDEGSSDQGKEKAEEKEEGKAALTWWVKKVMKKIGKKKNGMKTMTAIGPMIKPGMKAIGPMMIHTPWMSMDTSRGKAKEKEKERKARKARMMMEKEESQEMEKASRTMFNLNPHQVLPYRINKPNKLIILLLHQVLVMVSFHLEELNHYVLMLERQSQHVLMFWHPRMNNKKYNDALVVEDRTNVMQQHSKTGEDSLFWLEILMHFDKVYNDVQLVCPGKLVFKKVRLHGSHWQKAHHCFHMDALQR